MNLTLDQKTEAVKAIFDAVVESVKEAGPMGAPGGSLYAALMTYGFTLNQFEAIMDALIRIGKLEKRGQLYFIANSWRKVQ